MKYQAVIFDLFGTLVDNFGGGYSYELEAEGVLAELGSFTADQFRSKWIEPDIMRLRVTGGHKTLAEHIRYVCSQLGSTAADAAIERAVEIRISQYKDAFKPRPGTIETLARIKSGGWKIGLVTSCSHEAPLLWPTNPMSEYFDATVFSCCEGATKPDPRLYDLACKRLSVVPGKCLYVGDGDGRELTGATEFGMDAVHICMDHERELIMKRPEAANWQGMRITKLSGVLDIICKEYDVPTSPTDRANHRTS